MSTETVADLLTQALVALTGVSVPPGASLTRVRDGLDLPEGCSVEIETEALDILERVARLSSEDHVVYTCLQLRDSYGRRPTAREVFDAGAPLAPVRRRHGTWFDFVDSLGDLDDAERHVLAAHHRWFSDLRRARAASPHRRVVLQVLSDTDRLHYGADVTDLVRRWFALDGERLTSRLEVTVASRPAFDSMTAELVELRLAEIRTRRTHVRRVLPLCAPIRLAVGHRRGNPVLRLGRSQRPDTPTGDVEVRVQGEALTIRFGRAQAAVAYGRPGGPNLLPSVLRRWLGPTAVQAGTHHQVELVGSDPDGWELRPTAEASDPGEVIPLGVVPFYPELAVACGVATGQVAGHDVASRLGVQASVDLDAQRHFVVRAQGNSMDRGPQPIADGDLVLCEWATVTDPREVEGRPVLLTGGTLDEVLSVIKVPARRGDRWVLRSTNPTHPDQELDPTVSLRVVARVVEVVEERPGPVLWGQYDRNAIAALFGHANNPSWRTGHRDLTVDEQPHTVLMVNLRKPPGTPLERRYADRFLSPSELQWESQASTGPEGTKGRRILHHVAEGRTLHLFVRYHTKDAGGRGEPFVYCGTLRTLRHEGSRPIRVGFELESPLPRRLWRIWSG